MEAHVNVRWEQVKPAELSACDRIIQGGFLKPGPVIAFISAIIMKGLGTHYET